MPTSCNLFLSFLLILPCTLAAFAQIDSEIQAEKNKLQAECVKEANKILQESKIKYRDENKLAAKICQCAMEDTTLAPYIQELTEISVLKSVPRPPSDIEERSKTSTENFLKASGPIVARCIKTHSAAHMPRDADEES